MGLDKLHASFEGVCQQDAFSLKQALTTIPMTFYQSIGNLEKADRIDARLQTFLNPDFLSQP